MIIRTSDTPCTVLVIDDEPDVRATLAQVLEHLGYRAVALADGMAALDYLIAGAPADAAIVDLRLPVMNGTQIVRALHELRPSLAMLMVSGDPTVDRADFGSGVALLTKPFRIEALEAALHHALAARAPHASLVEEAER